MNTLGTLLREARETKGCSLQDAQEATKIQVKYLRALEEEDFTVLPEEPVFVKGFLRSYAQFLGVDPKEATIQYDLLTKPEEPVIEAEKEEPVFQKASKKDTSLAEKPSIKINWLFIAGAFFAIFLGSWAYNHLMTPASQAEKPLQQITVETEQPAAEVEKPLAAVKPATEKKEMTAPVSLETEILNDCWVQVTIDGKVILSEVLPAQTKNTWQGKESVSLRVGNAGGIQVRYNGEDLGVLGKQGEVLTKTFAKEEAE